MATHWGFEGKVKVGANAVLEVTKFEVTSTVEPVDDSSMGDTWETHIAGSGLKKWSGSLTCHWDELDTNGQGLLVTGASVSLTLAPEGDQTGDQILTGTASVTDVGITTEMTGSTVQREIKFKGSGPLVTGAAP